MDNLERYLDRVCRGLGGSASLRQHLRQELREHIQEAADRHRQEGLPADQALGKAIADFGDPVAMHEGFEDVYGRDVIGILIEKAMQWKENTMKAKWLWSGSATLLLLLGIFAQAFFAFCVLWLIVPKLQEMFTDVGEQLPGFAIAFLQVGNVLIFRYGWVWILLSLLIAWALFEWRYRGENKPLIRLSALALVSLATTALMWWAGIVAVVPLIHVRAALYAERPEQVVLEGARMAEEAMTRLDGAVKAQDWQSAREAAVDYMRAFEYGYIRESTAAGLVTMTQQPRMNEIRDQLRQLTMLAKMVQAASPAQLPERTQQIQQAYAQLKVLAGGWPQSSASQPITQPAAATEPAGLR